MISTAIALSALLNTATATIPVVEIPMVEIQHQRAWFFKVYLDDREIGTHRFTARRMDDHLRLISEASYQVKFLFIEAYAYEHRSEERWRDGCLMAINARTDDDGEIFRVSGQHQGGSFALERAKQPLGPCVMTFAYWNPNFLEQSRLLNVQTGEYLPVEISPLEGAGMAFPGDSGLHGFRLRNPDEDLLIEVWYDNSGNWVALDAAVDDGKVLRYRPADTKTSGESA